MSNEEFSALLKPITVEDFDKICRLCLGEEDVTCLSGSIFEDVTAVDLLGYCFSTKLNQSDFMPQNICSDCLAELSRLYGFKKQCEENEAILEALLSQQKNEKVDTEILKIEIVDDDDDEDDVDEDEEEEDIDYKQSEITIEEALLKLETGDDIQDIKEVKENGRIQIRVGRFKCNTCHKKFSSLKEFTDHKRTLKHAEYRLVTCEYCGKAISCKMLSTHAKSHGEKKFECDICYKAFSISNNLKRHRMKHTNERPFVCARCGKGFIQLVSLINHENNHEKDGRNDEVFSCTYCDRTFTRACRLANHVRHHSDTAELKNVENGESYLCEICSAVYPTARMFEQHLTAHAAKKFLCEICHKSFKSSFLLKTHRRMHTGEKPYTCTVCGKSFAHNSNFRTHVSIHTGERPYKCTFCPLSFRQDPHLKHHLRTHTGEKPYKCLMCAKSFAFKGNLTVHERIHTGFKPYVCSICDRGFYDSSSMKKHKWTHGIAATVKSEEGESKPFEDFVLTKI